MNTFDIVLIIVLLFGAYKGYRDGFLMELFSLLGIVLGILGAFKLMGVSLLYLSEHFDIDKKILPYVAFAVVFIAIVLVMILVGRMLKASIDKSFLGRVDEGAGAALGLLKMAFLMSVALWIASSLSLQIPEKWQAGSVVLPLLADFAPHVAGWVGELIPAFGDIFG